VCLLLPDVTISLTDVPADADGFRGIASLKAAIKIMGYINSGRKAVDELLPHEVFQVVSGAELGGYVSLILL
jgi:hypothetical protein